MPTKAVKGFNKDLTCRSFQYEIGKTYEHTGPVVRCTEGGFHSVEMPLDAWTYYPPNTSRYTEVLADGAIDRARDEDTKIASAKITINAELHISEMVKRAAAWIVAAAKTNLGSGDSGHAAATGDSGHAAATGDRGHAAATGYSGHAAATGDRGHAAVSGKKAIAAALGYAGTATAGEDGWLVLAYYDDEGKLKKVKTAKVGTEGIKPGKTYRLSSRGKFAEVK